MDTFHSFFRDLGNETNVTTPTDLTATDVWITMVVGTIGLIISIIITIFCFREKTNNADFIDPSPLLREASEQTPLVLHGNE